MDIRVIRPLKIPVSFFPPFFLSSFLSFFHLSLVKDVVILLVQKDKEQKLRKVVC